ncbi:MAG: segregation and condensation protein [Actinomycetota bacterium]|jgi:segregation and condensation protein B|nr:segregation and condensation protein [Actinomycetota bacterium]
MSHDRKIIESILLLAEEPVPAGVMGEVLERPTAEVEDELRNLATSYLEEDRGFVLREVAGGWRLYTSPDSGPWLERFVLGHRTARLSPAALEVLAIVAYKQPISRTQISEIRGVDSDRVVKTLLGRDLVEESGHGEGPGSPIMLRITDHLLERLGLNSLAELPALAGFMPDTEAVEDMEAKLSPGV